MNARCFAWLVIVAACDSDAPEEYVEKTGSIEVLQSDIFAMVRTDFRIHRRPAEDAEVRTWFSRVTRVRSASFRIPPACHGGRPSAQRPVRRRVWNR
jgi:hypothetical protein